MQTAAVAPSGSGGGPSGGGSPPVRVGGGSGGTSYYNPATTLPLAPPLLTPQFQVADFNGDNRIDITDLSIMLYYYGECGPAGRRYDLNHDGCVNFPDISILMYHWTGNQA